MTSQQCPYCGSGPVATTRTDGTATEKQCLKCRMHFTVKADHPGDVFAFFPADIDAAVSGDVQAEFGTPVGAVS